MYKNLYNWAQTNHQLNPNTQNYTLFHDNLKLTPTKKLRVMAAITVNESAKSSENVTVKTIIFGEYAYCCLTILEHQFAKSWQWLLNIWLPQSGYEKDNRMAFERVIDRHNIDGQVFLKVGFGLPVKKLNKNHK